MLRIDVRFGSFASISACRPTSAIHPIATKSRTSLDVRKVPNSGPLAGHLH
jgi:hypothetical protein